MRFALPDLFMATTMIAIHIVLMGACYPDFDSAFDPRPLHTVWLMLGLFAVSWWVARTRDRAGPIVCAGLIPTWRRWQWVAFGVMHLDLAYALIAAASPLALGPMRQIAILVALVFMRDWFLILACEGGVIVRGRLHPWRKLWSRLHHENEVWWLFLNSKSGKAIRELWLYTPAETLDRLREVRAQAVLDEPSPATRSSSAKDSQENHGSHE